MNYKEAVLKNIAGDGDELSHRKELWEKIVDSYEKTHDENAVSDVLNALGVKIKQEFEALLITLQNKL